MAPGDTAMLDVPEPESIRFMEATAFVRTIVTPGAQYTVIVHREAKSGRLFLAVPLMMPPGRYRIDLSVTSTSGEVRDAALNVTVEQARPLAVSSRPPVILLNGWQDPSLGIVGSCPVSISSKNTFGELESLLNSDGASTVFFDNCTVCPNYCTIEYIASALNQYLSTIHYTDGTPVQTVDLVAHSMGGLIARAYLAGKQVTSGVFLPPTNAKVRKLILIATPNFGSFQAPKAYSLIGGPQLFELQPGSQFLLDLATWNKGQDDLRGVDALAIVGNAGYDGNLANASDGVVSLTSAALGFAQLDQRTRIVPYCHTDPGFFAGLGMSCNSPPQGIAKVDINGQHPTARIVRSFLADTQDWMSAVLSRTPTQDPYLSQYGGIYFALENAGGTQYINDLTQVYWGSVPLQNGGATNSIFYNEFVGGQGTFQVASTSLGPLNCGPFAEPPGYFTVRLCKYSPPQPPALAVSTNSLQFAYTTGGSVPTGQAVQVSNNGGGSLAWIASTSASWLTVSPASGTAPSSFTVAVTPTGLGAGTYTGTVQISAAGASNNPQNIAITLTVASASAKPFGIFDTPIDGTTNVAGAVPVTGWALDSIEVVKVDIWREPVTSEASGPNGLVYIGDAVFVAGARPDVQAANPGLPFNYRAGWGYQMLTNFLPNAAGSGPSGNGVYRLHAIAHNKAGATLDLGTKAITVDNAHASKPFGTMDTPTQGGTPSGNAYVNFGWALAHNPNMIPIDGSTITVVVDGQPVGHPTYNNFRSDIATLFPGYMNSGGAVGFYYLDTTKLTNGVHTISWNVFDSVGHGDGIGSRYFNVFNSGGPIAAPQEETMEPATTTRAHAVEIEEVGHVELPLGVIGGYQLVDGERVPLPIGSSLKRGVFYWQPGPGFLGDYTLIFERTDGTETQVRVKIRPKLYAK